MTVILISFLQCICLGIIFGIWMKSSMAGIFCFSISISFMMEFQRIIDAIRRNK